MKYCIFLFLFACLEITHAQSDIVIELDVINPEDKAYNQLEKKIKRSSSPVFPSVDGYSVFKDSLTIEEYRFYDYHHTLSFGSQGLLKNREIRLRVFLSDRGDLKMAVDTDLDEELTDEKIFDVKNTGKELFVDINDHSLVYKYFIKDLEAIYENRPGGLWVKPLTYFTGDFDVQGKQKTVLVKDGVLGTRFYMENMFVGADSLSRVMLNEPFFLHDSYYVFQEFDLASLVVTLKETPQELHPEGYREGFYVNMEILQEKLKADLQDKLTILYFWGIWCQPCVSNFDKTSALYDKIKGEDKANMFFCSLNNNSEDARRSKNFLDARVDSTDQIQMFTEEVHSAMSDFVQYDSLISLLKITAYPTYVVIDKEGKILYRGSSSTSKEFLQLLLN